jgi:hypothetical protein
VASPKTLVAPSTKEDKNWRSSTWTAGSARTELAIMATMAVGKTMDLMATIL